MQQHQLFVCDIMISEIKELVETFVPQRKVWKLMKDATKLDFEYEF